MMVNVKNDEKKCGNCFWFTKADNPVSQVTHYCKLHYMQEAKRKNEKACNDWCEGGKCQ